MRHYLLFLLLLIGCSTFVTAQRNLLYFERSHLVGGMYNHFQVADCGSEITIPYAFVETAAHYDNPGLLRDSLEVRQPYDKTYRLTVPAEAWRVGFVVKHAGITDTVYRSVRPIVATIRFGGAGWQKDSLRGIVAKAQQGLYAQVEGYDISARCLVTGFSLTRVSPAGYQTVYNQGGSFQTGPKALINHLEPGDLLLFRQITYRCPGNEAPTKARDLIFTIY